MAVTMKIPVLRQVIFSPSSCQRSGGNVTSSTKVSTLRMETLVNITTLQDVTSPSSFVHRFCQLCDADM
jgi:hypothetical protein